MNIGDHLSGRSISRRGVLTGATTILLLTPLSKVIAAPLPTFQPVIGRPRADGVSINMISSQSCKAYIEYGISKTKLSSKTSSLTCTVDTPTTFEVGNLKPNSKYYYRIRFVTSSNKIIGTASTIGVFTTAKTPGNPFSFTLHGDTHPERAGKMYNADLYKVTLKNAASQNPDSHLLLGDDFSIDPLIQKGAATSTNVEKIYKDHRSFLTLLGTTTSVFLVNGNHEQAAAYLLDGTPNNPAIYAGKALTKYFALPETNNFYSSRLILIGTQTLQSTTLLAYPMIKINRLRNLETERLRTYGRSVWEIRNMPG